MAAGPESEARQLPGGSTGEGRREGRGEGKGEPLWFVDGKAYNFTSFMHQHPGGPLCLGFPGRDLSVSFHSYHRDPKRLLPILEKYRVPGACARPAQNIFPKSAQFLTSPDFDSELDVPTYDFDPSNPDLLLNDCRARVLAPGVQAKIRELDRGFDLAVGAIAAAYLSLLLAWLGGGVPWYLVAPAFAVLRTALAGAGHYYLHRKKPCLAEGLFDFNYVGTCLTAIDGHNMLHHAHTVTKADPKAGFFGGMMAVPRLWRVPIFTLHKLGQFLTGMVLRGLHWHALDEDGPQVRFRHLRDPQGRRVVPVVVWSFWAAHAFLLLEFALAVLLGLHGSWLAQFFLTLWVNTMLVVSSHDYEEQHIELRDSKDWGKYQLVNTMDLRITGNPWIDCFLSAGLSPHRAHHLFPYQRSGWANVYSTQFVRASAEKFGLPWEAPRCFQTERLPGIVRAYVLAPVADPLTRQRRYKSFVAEHLSPQAYWDSLCLVGAGLAGLGSI